MGGGEKLPVLLTVSSLLISNSQAHLHWHRPVLQLDLEHLAAVLLQR